MKKIRQKGLSLIELLVSIIVASILILTVGVLSEFALGSHKDLEEEAQVYKDLAYGFDLMYFSVRKANDIDIESGSSHGCLDNALIVDNSAFGVYAEPNGSRDLIYMPDQYQPADCSNSSPNNCEIILGKVANSSNPLTLTLNPIGTKSVSVQITGTKDKEIFDVSTLITRRNL